MVPGLLQNGQSGLKTEARRVVHALTIDLEDYFMVSAFEAAVPKSSWSRQPSRVGDNTRRVLDLLDEVNVRATFFSLGWVAERFPELIADVAGRGHEIACHGYDHRLVYDQTPAAFREDVRRSKRLLEEASGTPVLGYRAPSFSITERSLWALDILRDEGFVYDGSLLPALHARGGYADAERYPYRTHGLLEFPMSTLRFAGRSLPFSGGGYFRFFPYAVVRAGFRSAEVDGMPAIVYLHPWEFDPDQPRLPGRRIDLFRHHVNLHKTAAKLRRLATDFSFAPVRDVLSALFPDARPELQNALNVRVFFIGESPMSPSVHSMP